MDKISRREFYNKTFDFLLCVLLGYIFIPIKKKKQVNYKEAMFYKVY